MVVVLMAVTSQQEIPSGAETCKEREGRGWVIPLTVSFITPYRPIWNIDESLG